MKLGKKYEKKYQGTGQKIPKEKKVSKCNSKALKRDRKKVA